MKINEIREPIQKRSIEKKEKIIKSGFELICEKGYYNTNTAEIAKAAGVSTGIVYQYFKDKYGDIGTYSNFNKYVKLKNLKPKKAIRGHARFETPPGKQAQVDWKEDIKLTSKYGEVFIFNVFSYKLGNSRFCCFTYDKLQYQVQH